MLNLSITFGRFVDLRKSSINEANMIMRPFTKNSYH